MFHSSLLKSHFYCSLFDNDLLLAVQYGLREPSDSNPKSVFLFSDPVAPPCRLLPGEEVETAGILQFNHVDV